MKIPVGTSWDVPNGVETEVYVDIVLKYDPVDILGNSFIAVLSICDVDKGSVRSSDGVTYHTTRLEGVSNSRPISRAWRPHKSGG